MVIVNSFTVFIPANLAGGIDRALRDTLEQRGPYCQPFENVLPLLQIAAVKTSMYTFVKETGTWIWDVMGKFGFKDLTDNSIAIASSLRLGCGKEV